MTSYSGELLPCEGLTVAEMVLDLNQSESFANSGQSLVAEFGRPKWRLLVRTARLTRLEARIWSTWFSRREGRKVPFAAWRLMRRNLEGATGALDSSVTLSIDAANSRLIVTGDSGYVATAGDMVSYRTPAGGYWIGEVVADASAVGTVTTLEVRPGPVAPASVHWFRRRQALGEFRLINPPPAFEDYANRAIEFEARQVIR